MTTADARNIIDHYKYWKDDAIRADLDTKRHPFSIACMNFGIDFNIASVIRNANAFLASNVYVVGRRKWDRRGAVGSYHYLNMHYVKEVDELPNEYTWVAVDNVEGAEPIESFEWPTNPLIILGQESVGISKDILDRCKKTVYIRQYGSVRSLNVACASAIIMQDWCAKYYAKGN